MQLQPFQAQGPAAGANGDRIHVPLALGQPAGPTPPTLLTVFGREVRRRKKLVAVWVLVTAVLTGAVVLQFARPVYRAEGRYAYLPNYRAGRGPSIYTPPNIQSAVQILKAPDVLEPVRARHLPDVSKDEFGKGLKIEVARQSEFIDVAFDHPDPSVAAAVANDVMTQGLQHFTAERTRVMADGIAQVRADLEKARQKLQEALDDYTQTHLAQGVTDPVLEMTNIQIGLADVNRQLRAEREKEARLKKQIEVLTNRRDAPPDATDGSVYDALMADFQARIAKLTSDAANQQAIDEARIGLETAMKREAQYRPLRDRGVLPQVEYDDVVNTIKKHKATLAHADRAKEEREALQKQFEQLKKQSASGTPLRRAVIDQLVMLKTELAAIPDTVAALELELKQKQESFSRMSKLQKELSTKDEDIKLLRNRVQDFDTQVNDADQRGQQLHANDLRIHSVAGTGSAPYSTNAPKLALALVGASGLLFAGYMFLFGLPKGEPGVAAAGGLGGPPASRLPRALVALVPVTQAAAPGTAVKDVPPTAEDAPPAPAETATPPAAPAPEPAGAGPGPVPPHALAQRLAEDGVDQGGIVLFTPTAQELKVAPAIGEMGEYFTKRGERVLVFDARHDAETPSWAGSDGADVARAVEGYLDGRPAAPTDCFVPTALEGVEYSRADLSTRVGGVMAAHRFRQLLEEMRERYSLVFLVGPPVTVPGDDPLLATLAEGMVLVTESSASPSEVHAFVESLNQQAPARLFGTLSVPRA